ncbi:MAG: hypothetical protein M3680_32715 [Myxococcota bacterium]|nr:hypothetical protein [Myxococcota bacterium]
MTSRILLALAMLPGCVVGEELVGSEPPPDSEESPPVTARGIVLEPVNGSAVLGDPSTLSVRIAGEYAEADQDLSVQLLANPDDLTSWLTVGATRSVAQLGLEGATFAINIRPVASVTEQQRWPRGGVLRLRVLDSAGRALPFDRSAPDQSVIVVANPAELPANWQYLAERPVGSPAETLEYYATINAPVTLSDFMTRFGFPGNETTAVYYNAGDLGIGREMHCRATQNPAGGLACYVRNYGTFGGSRDEAIALTVAGGAPLATVAMVYTPPITAPNSVSFMVYGPDGAILTEAQLDTHGDNTSIPQNCLNCHGGRSRYDDVTNEVIGARFLPFDPSAFAYAQRADLTFVAQDDKFRRLNRLVAAAAPTTAVRTTIEGMYPLDNRPFDPAFVPAGWSASKADQQVYRTVIAPYCRGCHVSFESPTGGEDSLAFTTAASFKARAVSVVERLCGEGPKGMPTAEITTAEFFNSPARAVLLQWLGQPGACAPVTQLSAMQP